jgi:hypothetical protein
VSAPCQWNKLAAPNVVSLLAVITTDLSMASHTPRTWSDGILFFSDEWMLHEQDVTLEIVDYVTAHKSELATRTYT